MVKILNHLKQTSLFDEKTVYILQFENSKLTKENQFIIQTLANSIRNDHWLIFIFPKLDSAQQKPKWFTTLEQNALWIQLWPLQGNQLIQWLKEKLTEKKITTSPQGLQLHIRIELKIIYNL